MNEQLVAYKEFMHALKTSWAIDFSGGDWRLPDTLFFRGLLARGELPDFVAFPPVAIKEAWHMVHVRPRASGRGLTLENMGSFTSPQPELAGRQHEIDNARQEAERLWGEELMPPVRTVQSFSGVLVHGTDVILGFAVLLRESLEDMFLSAHEPLFALVDDAAVLVACDPAAACEVAAVHYPAMEFVFCGGCGGGIVPASPGEGSRCAAECGMLYPDISVPRAGFPLPPSVLAAVQRAVPAHCFTRPPAVAQCMEYKRWANGRLAELVPSGEPNIPVAHSRQFILED